MSDLDYPFSVNHSDKVTQWTKFILPVNLFYLWLKAQNPSSLLQVCTTINFNTNHWHMYPYGNSVHIYFSFLKQRTLGHVHISIFVKIFLLIKPEWGIFKIYFNPKIILVN